MQIIDRIDKSKEETRKHVDEKFDKLDKKFGELDRKIDELNADVAFVNGQLTIIKWSITIFGAPFLVGLLIYYLQNRKKKFDTTADITTEVSAENKKELDEGVIRRNLIGNQQSETEIA